MSMEYPNIIETGTIGVYRRNMRETLFVYNEKLGLLVPAGGKRKNTDRNIVHTAVREGGEELGIALFYGTGIYLDKNGKPIDYPEIVAIEDYKLLGKAARDFFFYFRLYEGSPFVETTNIPTTSAVTWLTREDIVKGRKEVGGKMMKIVEGTVKENILKIMR